jgi:hypothetical protein
MEKINEASISNNVRPDAKCLYYINLKNRKRNARNRETITMAVGKTLWFHGKEGKYYSFPLGASFHHLSLLIALTTELLPLSIKVLISAVYCHVISCYLVLLFVVDRRRQDLLETKKRAPRNAKRVNFTFPISNLFYGAFSAVHMNERLLWMIRHDPFKVLYWYTDTITDKLAFVLNKLSTVPWRPMGEWRYSTNILDLGTTWR